MVNNSAPNSDDNLYSKSSVENLTGCKSKITCMSTDPPFTESENINPMFRLKKIKMSNANRLVIAHLNINSLRNKCLDLQLLIKEKIDVLLVTETKLDASFPTSQFTIEGYSTPFRNDRDGNGGWGNFIHARRPPL